MFAGFDYGTSNCAIGTIKDDQTQLIPLENEALFVPSTLYVVDRRLVTESVLRNIHEPDIRQHFLSEREGALRSIKHTRDELSLQDDEQVWFMGEEAIKQYMAHPGEGWFIKSPKSFLGATGLQPRQFNFFEDVVTLMMQHIKQRAEHNSEQCFDQVVIGRPINFQGIGGEKSNQQAINIMSNAAKTAGFKNVEFFYEPLAAGIDFEAKLDEDKTVLVVDLGGGTSDCSIVRMGPSYRHKDDRADDFLAHSGVRVGGNDLDVSLNYQEIMPLFGRESLLKNGLPVPAKYYFNAARINDINAQTEFASTRYADEIITLLRNATQPERIKYLQTLQHNKQNYQLSRSIEQCKIALSEADSCVIDLHYIDEQLNSALSVKNFENAIDKPLQSITQLITEALSQSPSKPDIVYITGGTSKSPSVQKAIRNTLGDIPVIDGDYFGSVTAGLTKWAEKIFAG